LLRQCLTSIAERTAYPNYEIVVIDNGSTDPAALKYLDTIRSKWRVVSDARPFNFSRLNNRGVAESKGEYLVFLNNDTEIVDGDWLHGMLEHAQRPEVGAVGMKLLYPDSRIQHAGVVLGIGGVAGHAFKYMQHGGPSYYDFADVVRDVSAVTA